MQILLPKSVNSAIAEVIEVLSDTELRVKREFGGESGKGTVRIREKLLELRNGGVEGLEYKKMPFVDQQEMYRHVYQCLNMGGSIGIMPEGKIIYFGKYLVTYHVGKVVVTIERIFYLLKLEYQSWHLGQWLITPMCKSR